MAELLTDRWQTANARFNDAMLAWLRVRLEQRAARIGMPAIPLQSPAPTETPPAEPAMLNRWRLIARRSRAADAPAGRGTPIARFDGGSTVRIALPEPNLEALAAELLAVAQKAGNEAEAAGSPPSLLRLAESLGLTVFEQNTLLLCAAADLDPALAPLIGAAQGTEGVNYPTLALALTLFDDPDHAILSPEQGLRRWRLIEITQPAGQPLTASPLRADERIVNYLNGVNYLDDRLASVLAPLDVTEDCLEISPSQRESVQAISAYWDSLDPRAGAPLVALIGPDRLSRQLVAWHAADTISRRLYRMPVTFLPPQSGDLEVLARLWHRESLLLPIALYIDADDAAERVNPSVNDGGAVDAAGRLARFLARTDGVLFLGSRDAGAAAIGGQPAIVVDIDRPTRAEQTEKWTRLLGQDSAGNAAQLAGQFSLNLSHIHSIVTTTLRAPESKPLAERLWDACLARTRPRLDDLAQRLDSRATWDDLVLPPEELDLLQRIADQVGQRARVYDEWGMGARMSRGWGISALFAGESGTGKTMAAEVIANHLRLHLYRIDLSAVVSKYIGETEKNLRRLFDAAEDGGAILLFDEADALFGKRSEVKDSHDRYANIEINYLLQRMESYRGLAILATNQKSALDTAFMRRLRFVIDFKFPSERERKAIWERAFPRSVPAEPLDFSRLARLPATGGMIHNIALNAAFAAAAAGTAVSMPFVLEAARAEFRKLERPISEREFAWLTPTGVTERAAEQGVVHA
jgi:hypothetical protein